MDNKKIAVIMLVILIVGLMSAVMGFYIGGNYACQKIGGVLRGNFICKDLQSLKDMQPIKFTTSNQAMMIDIKAMMNGTNKTG